MREEHIITSDYKFIEGKYFAKLLLRAETSSGMSRLFFWLSDGRKIITPVFWWQSYLGFYEIDNRTNLRLIYETKHKGISLKKVKKEARVFPLCQLQRRQRFLYYSLHL